MAAEEGRALFGTATNVISDTLKYLISDKHHNATYVISDKHHKQLYVINVINVIIIFFLINTIYLNVFILLH